MCAWLTLLFAMACLRSPEARRQSNTQDLSASCRLRTPAELAIPAGETELIFVRHGISLNNVFGENPLGNAGAMSKVAIGEENAEFDLTSDSRFQAGYAAVCQSFDLCGNYSKGAPSSLRWEIRHQSQDCLLHPVGEQEAKEFHNKLLEVLPEDAVTGGFYVSPLRRTLQTFLQVFGGYITSDDLVQVMPWAHETFKSMSDYSHNGDISAAFLERYADRASAFPEQALQRLRDQLIALGDWPSKWASSTPKDSSVPVPVAVQETSLSDSVRGWLGQAVDKAPVDPDLAPFYPKNKLGLQLGEDMTQRMTILRRWMQKLEPGKRHVLVSHGNVGMALFGPYAPDGKGKLENLGTIVARFSSANSDASDAASFFSSVQVAEQAWECEDLPGWKVKTVEDSEESTADEGLTDSERTALGLNIGYIGY